jgi:hypothetical protein
LWIAIVFSHMVFLFHFFIFQNYIFQLYFFNIELIENLVFYFFSLKHCWLLQCFSAWFFFVFVFLWFSLKLSFSILFFNIELVKNYSYNMWEKHCNFPCKLLWIATVFFSTWFFSVLLCFFLKLSLSILIFKYWAG